MYSLPSQGSNDSVQNIDGTHPLSTPRKRRVPSSITANACSNCKRARAKCDGAKPCGRCFSRRSGDSCHYDVHTKTAKEHMMREIEQYKRKNEDLQEQKDTLVEENALVEQIMSSLKEDGQYVEIINRLKRGESHQAIAEWLGRPMMMRPELSPQASDRFNEAVQSYHRDLVENKDPRFWTNVTQDTALIEHLISLYFIWFHPSHMVFDEERFTTSFKNCVDVYCSPALVNVLCATSCSLLHELWDAKVNLEDAISSLRTSFMNEARIHLKAAERKTMTTLQTYAVMFLCELTMGNGLKATSYLRLATETLITKRETEQVLKSHEISSWGILTLNTAWSGLTCSKPTAPVSSKANVFQDINLGVDEDWPGRHSFDGDQPGYTVLTAFEMARLCRIVHETILLYCGGYGKASADHLFKIYRRFRLWREELTLQVRDVVGDPKALPHVLSLHIHFHVSIINLLRPLLSLPNTSREASDFICSALLQQAQAGLGLFIQYRDAYGALYQSPLLLFCLVHICDAIVSHDGQVSFTASAIRFCMEYLQDAKARYPLAGPLQTMFATSVIETGNAMPSDLRHLPGNDHTYQLDDLLNACTRASYRIPIAQLLPTMSPTLAEDFVREWWATTGQQQHVNQEISPRSSADTSTRSLHINDLLND